MVDLIGYIGLTINLLSMTMKDILWLRWLSIVANFIYICYGVMLGAIPFIIGCSIAVCIHIYHLSIMYSVKKKKSIIWK